MWGTSFSQAVGYPIHLENASSPNLASALKEGVAPAPYDQISEWYTEAFTLQDSLDLCPGSTGPPVCFSPAREH